MSDYGGLRRTPLYERHLSLSARMVEFGGWEMPVQYSGIIDEHRAVREAAGLFDISHMGEVRCRDRTHCHFSSAWSRMMLPPFRQDRRTMRSCAFPTAGSSMISSSTTWAITT